MIDLALASRAINSQFLFATRLSRLEQIRLLTHHYSEIINKGLVQPPATAGGSDFMANIALQLPENVPGDFFVDSTCIDCDACRQIAPETFAEQSDASIVFHQPETEEETKRALMALVACPTGSIGTIEHHDAHIGIDAFPELIADNVFYCGFNAESSFGAWSYLILRPDDEGGNVLIDSPRFATQLVKKIDAMA